MCRSITLLTVIFAFNFLTGQNFLDKNDTQIKVALERAKIEHKQVFINFLSTSCENSQHMEKQIEDDTLKPLFDYDYIMVNIEVPEDKTSEFVTCENPVKSFGSKECEAVSFPFWYIVSDEGYLVETSFRNNGNIGYPITKEDVNEFVDVIRNTSQLTEEELGIILASFHENNNKNLIYNN